jgi:Ran GTPase-activating protein (RanGAP) involved in mRNA processing and transport
LAQFTNLSKLNLARNELGPDSLRYLFEENLSVLPSIHELDLEDNLFNQHTLDAATTWINRGTSQQLRALNLGSVFVEQLDMDRFLMAIKNHPMEYLEFLSLEYAGMDDDEAVRLASALEGCPNLRQLNVNGNRIKNIQKFQAHLPAGVSLGKEVFMDENDEEPSESGQPSTPTRQSRTV